MAIKISVTIITYNEGRNLQRCLDSIVGIADEIVVIDSFSTDETEAICHKNGVIFIQNPFLGHIEQKNFAISKTKYDWVLSLDADESLSEKLKDSLIIIKKNTKFQAYSMNRLTNYAGQWIYHCGWYPDRKLRFFNKNIAVWGGTNPHDKIELKGSVKTELVEGNLLHYSYYSVEEHFEKSKKYAKIAAEAMHQKGKKSTWFLIVFSPIFKFLRDFIVKLGFLDGFAGLKICYISALVNFWKYKMLKNMR
jgi:glycosyltransferase involved in cell wall biosynthesis